MAAPALAPGKVLLKFFPTAAEPALEIDQIPRLACDDDQRLAPEPADLAIAALEIRQGGQHGLRRQRQAERQRGLLINDQRAVVDAEQPLELRAHQSGGRNIHGEPKQTDEARIT
ncbi:hypothetical protein KL909_002023 [Ogataea angusta]|nr:hypothetical protein KL909_002023 [Ogataea angusta]